MSTLDGSWASEPASAFGTPFSLGTTSAETASSTCCLTRWSSEVLRTFYSRVLEDNSAAAIG
jgi:hypothetical protein